MGREKLYIKGIETARADELRLTQDSVETVSQELSSYKEEVDTSLEELKEEVRQIVAEGGEAEPIIISSTGITISVANNQEALLDALNTLLKKEIKLSKYIEEKLKRYGIGFKEWESDVNDWKTIFFNKKIFTKR